MHVTKLTAMEIHDRIINLDNNATTPVDPQVNDAMAVCQAQGLANPASQHSAGQRARRQLEQLRDQICRHLRGRRTSEATDRLIFTSGGTEANNLALYGLVGLPPGRVIVSAVEHPSIQEPADELQQCGFEVIRLGVDASGVVCCQQLADLLTPETRLVSIMLGNNETGVLQPIRQIARLCEAKGVPLHTDAVQAVGKIDVNFQDLGVAALSLSGHKLHGPVGIGALLVRSALKINPLLRGGRQQQGVRPGTESVCLAVGLERALALWHEQAQSRGQQLSSTRDHLETHLCRQIPQAVINGLGAPRLPHTSNVSFPGVDRQLLFLALDQAGVACSTGSACSSGATDASPVLRAMNVPEALLEGALRFSVGVQTTQPQIDLAVDRIVSVFNHLRRDLQAKNRAHPGRHGGPKTL
ncbi:MAG: cysteine desulfurase family protein [Planctomycetota bacterium]|nr:cysteine desulfurase family protein [Planctomycetota bacterium]